MIYIFPYRSESRKENWEDEILGYFFLCHTIVKSSYFRQLVVGEGKSKIA